MDFVKNEHTKSVLKHLQSVILLQFPIIRDEKNTDGRMSRCLFYICFNIFMYLFNAIY